MQLKNSKKPRVGIALMHDDVTNFHLMANETICCVRNLWFESFLFVNLPFFSCLSGESRTVAIIRRIKRVRHGIVCF